MMIYPHICVAGGSRCWSFSRRQAELRHARGWWHSKVRDIFLKQSCRRKALNAAFTLSNVHSEDFFLWILPEQISKYLHSGFYDADEDGQKVCLELSCAVGSLCRCSECLCCFVLPGCLASTCDFNFILQQLLIAQPCFSYQ